MTHSDISVLFDEMTHSPLRKYLSSLYNHFVLQAAHGPGGQVTAAARETFQASLALVGSRTVTPGREGLLQGEGELIGFSAGGECVATEPALNEAFPR